MKYKVKYCRIIREPFGVYYRFFLQLVMEGVPPQKHAIGAGAMAIDPGVSTMASYNGSKLSFIKNWLRMSISIRRKLSKSRTAFPN